MTFEWDENKNRINKTKHGVDFETAATVFNDPLLASRIERVVDGEERWQSIGMADGLILLLVAHLDMCENEKIIHIISARKADNHERRRYESGTF